MAALSSFTSSSRLLASQRRPSVAFSAAQRPFLAPQNLRRSALVCQAQLQRPGVKASVEAFVKRYDFLSTGMGALMVTGYCWSKGQDPITALSITGVATIVALVANELMTSSESSQDS